ncbi:MAG TPA: calcineurin-like phosphoesterase family protein [Acetobacteraceae bacterium]|nr:calcineurin-like phosphoesterase family protein [Acetobacteraceae bacterium]
MDFTRRDILVAGAAVAFASHAAEADPATDAPAGHVAERASGHVLDAASRDPIPNAAVSNGRDVVLTDNEGGFSLPVRDGDSIFVIKPRGWMVPLEKGTNLPRCAVLHQPQGTPAALDFRYPGVAPTGPLPDNIEFLLTRADEPDKFNVLLCTDPQPETEAELGYVRDTAVTLAAMEKAAFGITTGDVMFDDLSMYGRHNRLFGTLGLPWWNLPGNHDMNYEAPDDFLSKETFKRLFGARHYAFQYGPATFIMLDNVEYLGGNKYRGRIGQEQLGFVRAVLGVVPHDAPVIVCMHIPLRTAVGDEPFSATTDYQDFLALIGDRPNCISFSGHTHTNEHHYLGAAQHHHHVLTAVSGSWWSGPADMRGIPVALASDGAPNGFHVLSIDGASCRTRLVSCEHPAGPPLRVVLDTHFDRRTGEVARALPMSALLGGTVTRDDLASARLLVNFFVGGPRSSVRYAIEGGEPQALKPLLAIDPFVQQVYWRNEASKKPWVHPVKSTHLWEASLPPDLALGAHRCTISAVDEFGVSCETGFVVEVTS